MLVSSTPMCLLDIYPSVCVRVCVFVCVCLHAYVHVRVHARECVCACEVVNCHKITTYDRLKQVFTRKDYR